MHHSPRTARILITAAAVLLLLGASACKEKKDAAGAPATASTATATATAATATAAAKTGSNTDAAKLLAGLATASYSVTYKIETTGQAGAPPLSGTFKQIQDSTGKRTRFDMEFAGAGAGQMTMIKSGTTTVMCTSGRCLSLGAAGAGAFPDPSQSFTAQMGEVEKSAQAGNVKEVASRTIAGVKATCFQFSSTGAGITDGTSCVSAEGVPLFGEWQSGTSRFKLEATAYANSVKDADFTPPFPITAAP